MSDQADLGPGDVRNCAQRGQLSFPNTGVSHQGPYPSYSSAPPAPSAPRCQTGPSTAHLLLHWAHGGPSRSPHVAASVTCERRVALKTRKRF